MRNIIMFDRDIAEASAIGMVTIHVKGAFDTGFVLKLRKAVA